MARGKKTGRRIEPRFGSDERGDMRVSADDRVAGGGKRPVKKARRKPGSKSKARKSARKARPGWILRTLRRGFYWGFIASIWGGMAIAGIVLFYAAQMPNATTWSIPDRPPNVKILAVSGETMANRGATGGEALSLNDMSPYIPQAVLAIEDRRFYSHFGIDPLGLTRAIVTNLLAGRTVQGGSTLTQQLAKNLFLTPERTIERKVQEVLLAFWLEHEFSKDQILTMYLNRVYFGSGAYGVEAASRRYFKKPARDVNLAEAALLAGLLKAPSRLSPARDPKAAEERSQVVLEAMRDTGFVTDSEVTTAMTRKPTKAKSYWSGAENYVADMVMSELSDLIGEIGQDLVVDTTIDMELEHEAEKAIASALNENGETMHVSQGALVALDGTGAVRALVGGRDYAASQFNRASDAKRQPGSAFKPFVYTAALEMGRQPGSVRIDAPVKIGKWTPENYNRKYRGEVTLSEALADSLNTIAAQLVMEVGPKTVVSTAHRMGIASDIQANASIALGTSEVSLLELTSAYAPFMNGGYKATPHIIRRIRTLSGKVLYENTYDNPPRVLDTQVAIAMNSMLTRVVERGTGRAARLDGWQVGGKTGTTQSFRDALFVGYTANLTTGVWFGNDDGAPMKKVTGGNLPAKAWKNFMAAAHQGLPPSRLPFAPSNVTPTARPGEPLVPPGDIGEVAADQGTDSQPTGSVSGPLPPANVGENQNSRQTTLLDILLGQ